MRTAFAVVVAFLLVTVGFFLGAVVNNQGIEKPTIEDVSTSIQLGNKASPVEPVLVADFDNEYEPEDKKEANDTTPEEGPAIHEDLRDETPPGVPEDAAEEIVEDIPSSGMVPIQPVGGAQNYSCPRNLVRNFSNRTSGTVVGLFVLHYTVSRPGSLDVIR